ncbi:MAG: hypothetical protein HYU69_00345 [Bacteroidetes bacterium]|nr:hypothetical protein [Bacteroidota bacterium]
MSKELQNIVNAEIKSINPAKKPLTIEVLRTFPEFRNVTDAEADEIIFSLQIFTELFHEFYVELEKMKQRGEINDIIEYLMNQEPLKIAA